MVERVKASLSSRIGLDTGTPNFQITDPFWTVNIASNPVGVADPVIAALLNACYEFNEVTMLDGVAFADNTTTISLADARVVRYTVLPGETPPSSVTFTVETMDYWSEAEFNAIRVIAQAVAALQLGYALTGLDITYYPPA